MVLIAAGFGAAMGFGLGAFLDDIRPSMVALAVALVAGVGVLAGSVGSRPREIGGSLVIGTVAAIVALGVQRVGSTRRADGSG